MDGSTDELHFYNYNSDQIGILSYFSLASDCRWLHFSYSATSCHSQQFHVFSCSPSKSFASRYSSSS